MTNVVKFRWYASRKQGDGLLLKRCRMGKRLSKCGIRDGQDRLSIGTRYMVACGVKRVQAKDVLV